MNDGIITRECNIDLAVLGAGLGGYTAAFRAADLGKSVILIERTSTLGGVCLKEGCIPSKTLLQVVATLAELKNLEEMGVYCQPTRIELERLRAGKDQVIKRLITGLEVLAKRRKVQFIQGDGYFETPYCLSVDNVMGGRTRVHFEHCVIACGSTPIILSNFPSDPRIINSTAALDLQEIPQRLLIIGGGVIGLEIASIYHALGSEITIVELQNQLLPGCDPDLVKVLEQQLRKKYKKILLQTKILSVTATEQELRVKFSDQAESENCYDKILVAIGRRPNSQQIQAIAAGVIVDDRGFIPVDSQLRTNISHIFAIGDVAGHPMLAHKATHEGKIAAEVSAGLASNFNPLAIPAVAYTDPEVAWTGVTETMAQNKGIAYQKSVFPWIASGRAVSLRRTEGFTKLLFDSITKRLLGAGIVGLHAGELISELVLAIEMGATQEDLALMIHPHPTLSETIGLAAEVAHGSITDLLPIRIRK